VPQANAVADVFWLAANGMAAPNDSWRGSPATAGSVTWRAACDSAITKTAAAAFNASGKQRMDNNGLRHVKAGMVWQQTNKHNHGSLFASAHSVMAIDSNGYCVSKITKRNDGRTASIGSIFSASIPTAPPAQ